MSHQFENKLNLRYYRVLTMVYNTQRYWVFGLCPSSGFFLNNNEKHKVSETGSVSVLRWGKTPTLLGPLERANLNQEKERLRWQGPAAYIKVRPVLSSERAPHKKKEKRNCYTSNKYMATGPTGARCQEWPCRLIAGSKLLLCSASNQ
jgi:hypothetical protein